MLEVKMFTLIDGGAWKLVDQKKVVGLLREGRGLASRLSGRCAYSSPIKKVEFDRNNDGRTPEEVLAETEIKELIDRGPGPTFVDDELDEEVELDDAPHLSGRPRVDLQVDWLAGRLPGLHAMQVVKLPQTDTRYRNAADTAARLQKWQDRVSTLVDAATSAELAPQALLRADQADEAQQEDCRPVMGDIYQLANTLPNTPDLLCVWGMRCGP